MPRKIARSPRTKSELLDRMLSYSFTGDFRTLSPTGTATIKRTRPNALAVDFPDTDAHFELVVRKPRIAGAVLSQDDGDGDDEEDGDAAKRRAKARAPAKKKKLTKGRKTTKRGRN